MIGPNSPPADALTVGIPPAARTYNHGRAIEAITSASAVIASAAIEATTAAAEATATAAIASSSSSATARQRGRSRPADQNGRGAGDVDEQQSQRCEAAGQDIVAFSHSGISGSLPRHLDFGTVSLRRARQLSVQMRKTIFLLRFFRAVGTLLRRAGKVKLWPVYRGFLRCAVHLPECLLNADGCAPQNSGRSYGKATPAT